MKVTREAMSSGCAVSKSCSCSMMEVRLFSVFRYLTTALKKLELPTLVSSLEQFIESPDSIAFMTTWMTNSTILISDIFSTFKVS